MGRETMTEPSATCPSTGPAELLLQETIHRSSNDLQMIVGLLDLQARRAVSAEAKQALTDTMDRVIILARARSELNHGRRPSLATALQHVCTAVQSQAEPRHISVALTVERDTDELSPTRITTLALVVNELSTNAIKHGYEDGKAGSILITQKADDAGGVIILVDDDGLPFPDPTNAARGGMGLDISRRMMASIGGLFIPPPPGSKVFELRVPAAPGR